MSATWHALVLEADVPAEGKHAAIVAGWHVLLARTESGWHAVNDRCTHQAAMLSGGRIRRGAIMCPLHGARFDLSTGKCIGGTYPDLRRFAVRVVNGMIEVELPDTPPGIHEVPIAG